MSKLTLAALGERVSRLGAGERLTLVGIDRDGVGDQLRAELAHGRSALLLAHGPDWSVGRIIDHLLDDLAKIALSAWPDWDRGAPAPGDRVTRTMLDPPVSAPWLRAASRLASAGKLPRFRRIERRFEIAQLLRVIDPSALILIGGLEPALAPDASSVIQVLEWCAALGMATVAALPVQPPRVAPYDRVVHGALELLRDVEPVETRYIGPQGRAHGGSPTEARVQAAMLADAELGPLFEYNRIVDTSVLGQKPRVDLLWPQGRVVVELDGPEHFFDPAYGADRHRDYELLVAGYLVLRLTNAEIATDLERAIEKVRTLVRFRRSQQGV